MQNGGLIAERHPMSLQCSHCERSWPLDPALWRCDCGGALAIEGAPSFDPTLVNESDHTLWRYQSALPLPDGATPVTLGEGGTPLVATEWEGRPLYLKAEHLNPTGSFKDREILAAQKKLARQGVYVEPTSALVVAALGHLRDRLGKTPVAVLAGSGFKTLLATINWQQRIAAFIRRYCLRHDPSVHALDLVSEVGEVAKEVLLATDYGQREPEFRPELMGELGDAFYSLLALTNACGVDADSALNAALEKYERRLAEQGKAGST